MRVAIPKWGDKISPVLDTASRLLVLEVEDGVEASRFEISLDSRDLSRRCMRIKGLGVDVLVCGAVSRPIVRMLAASGTKVIPGISGSAEEVLDAYLKGSLFRSRFLMPGCRKRGPASRRRKLHK